ncbi:MAG: glycosyltransferase [Blastocatellia bacterium]|nr:glycosyltransferase [Blastocatellia bacterium]
MDTSKQIDRSRAEESILRGRDIVCFSHDWTGDPLSKTHLMRVLSKENRILWVNSIANRKPTASSKDVGRILRKLKSFTESMAEKEPNIFVLSPLSVPAYGSSFIRKFNERLLISQVKGAMKKLGFKEPVNMVFNPAAGLVAGKIGEKELIYYCVDDYTAFTGAAKGLRGIEEDLFRRSDLVIVSAEKLLRDKEKFNANTHIIRHGTDWNHFRTALDADAKVPEEIAGLPRPIIGFHGLLADWVDFELIKKVAEHFSTGSVVLIGKSTVDAEEKIKVLNGVANVHFLGRKRYEQLPAYCKGFDVALNPFVLNELTLAANPLKVREYLAAGLMTVSTDIPEVHQLKDCLVGTDHADFVEKIGAALNSGRKPDEISDGVKHESWEARVEELRKIMAVSRKK